MSTINAKNWLDNKSKNYKKNTENINFSEQGSKLFNASNISKIFHTHDLKKQKTENNVENLKISNILNHKFDHINQSCKNITSISPKKN